MRCTHQKENKIVNQCGCDPHNMPTRPRTTHTPGKGAGMDWRAEEIDGITGIISDDGVVIARVNAPANNKRKCSENAKLIAAAPDLLNFAEAIETIMDDTGHNLNSTATQEERTLFIQRIITAWNNGGYSAIAKARGI